MAATIDSKSIAREGVWVRLPPPAYKRLDLNPAFSVCIIAQYNNAMHIYEEFRQILDLWERGTSKKRISVVTGINRTTVRECILEYGNVRGLDDNTDHSRSRTLQAGLISKIENDAQLFEAYSYLLGLYLGDGYIAKGPRTYRLRIVLCTSYPDIIERCIQAIRVVFSANKVNTQQKQGNCLEVYCYNSHLTDLFPQHGSGRKHSRPIVLEDWQQQIVNNYPIDFLRGLIHSDGSRPHNIVMGKDYPRYEFSNRSSDILKLFSSTCDLLGIHWRTSSAGRGIQVARRKDVEFLDQFIGPKS